MATIAYVDHSFHMKTVSTKFITDLLISKGHKIDFFWDEAWQGGESIRISEVLAYDAVIMFQSFCNLEGNTFYRDLHPNVTYIPMLDQFGVWKGPLFNFANFIKPFQGCKIISFSSVIHGMAIGAGIRSKPVRFYPKPAQTFQEKKGRHGFLWIRRENEVSWQVVKKLIKGTRFDSFHLHVARDPDSLEAILPTQKEMEEYNITFSNWFEKKSDFERVLEKVNIYFAPRMEEGIGQSFLEAFTRGQCVVAPNNGTMNEYIVNGFNGLLYDWENLQPLDFSDANVMGGRTYDACNSGHEKWMESSDDLVDFIFMPNQVAYQNRYDYFNDYSQTPNISLKNVINQKLKNKLKNIKVAKKIYNTYKKFRD